jgi:hypothetical protein
LAAFASPEDRSLSTELARLDRVRVPTKGVYVMAVKVLYGVSLVCATLVLGLTLTHDLEIPGMRSLTGIEWLAVQHTFFGGYAIVVERKLKREPTANYKCQIS